MEGKEEKITFVVVGIETDDDFVVLKVRMHIAYQTVFFQSQNVITITIIKTISKNHDPTAASFKPPPASISFSINQKEKNSA